ncbi:phage tail sheath subtilisin-like domain-containing protein [Okeania sp. SIO2B3]|uniref:phage tail sheath family protein n=1 Tax=Okeania sp. SIO2B3 TaxID=2607784 RepID=UPI0013C1A9CF|nr:phage tail sheath subtilisin-like domain-containing protein [Okeania sp. SIO2B3]NET46329.1 phage tail sheath family protein [Okeania sp. SIO2B3]
MPIPGISLNEIVLTAEPELLTGVPVFFGLAEEHHNEPQKLTLWTQFDQYFPSLLESEEYLRDAVKGFFENGGRLCYVIALADDTPKALQEGLEASEILENIDLVCVPDIILGTEAEIVQMQQTVLEHCERMGDRFAILDGLNNNNIDKLNWIKQLNGQREQLSSHNGALYAPWLKIEDLTNSSKPKSIPPCGHIAGIYASSDRTVGVHGAPANIELEGVLDLSLSLTPTEQAKLNPENEPGINCIRSLRGRGIRVWGVRTLSSLPEWQYVNVRRLFLTFARWANQNLTDTVFEPNDFRLWVRLERELSVYCESLWQQGAIQGAVPQEAFYVKCDEETNPPENREMGQVIAEVGLAPTIPGEFIQLLLVQSSSGITVT